MPGQAFNRVKIRNLLTDRVVERTFKSGESVDAADVMDVEMQYLYNDGEMFYFMDTDTFEQIAADARAVGENAKWPFSILTYSACICSNLFKCVGVHEIEHLTVVVEILHLNIHNISSVN